MPLRFAASCLGFCFVFGVSIHAADWPQWLGPQHNGHVPVGEPVPTKLPDEPKVIWRLKIGDGVASPVIARDVVYYLDNQTNREVLHAVGAADGKEIWRADLDQVARDSQSVPGPRCTPVTDGVRVYAQSMKGELHCLDTGHGNLVWRVNFAKDFGAPPCVGEVGTAPGATRHGNTASPVIDGDRLYAMVGAPGGSVVAFEKSTGRVIWKSQDDIAGYAAPVITEIAGERILVAFTVDGLMGLALNDGRLLWRVPMQTAYGRHAVTPVVVGDMVLAGSYTFGLIGVRVTRDGANWLASREWVSKESAVNFACPVSVGEYVYGLGPNKNIFCVEAKTGKRAWSKEGLINTSADNAFAGLLAMGGNILVLNDTGELVLFSADNKGFTEQGRVQVCGRNWCNPAYAGGRLYLRDARELLCVSLLP